MTVSVEVDERIEKCQKILRQDPNSQIFAALAEAYRKKGDLDEAFRVCQNGLRIHSSYGSAHVVMAKINLDRGLHDWAEAEVEKAVELDGSNRAVDLLLAEIHISKGEFDLAISLLKTLHRADPDNVHISKLLEIARKIPEEQQAMAAGSQMVEPEIQEPAELSDTNKRRIAVPEFSDAPTILKAAVKIKDLEGALFINTEGLVVESEWSLALSAETCGAQMAELDAFLTQELVRASFGQCRAVLIETGSTVLYLYRVENGYFLFAGNKDIVLGTLRMRIDTLMKRFKSE